MVLARFSGYCGCHAAGIIDQYVFAGSVHDQTLAHRRVSIVSAACFTLIVFHGSGDFLVLCLRQMSGMAAFNA
jgi:hypothetical protein